jgi:diguanylate cyclase (GGDEF)-like protein/PAS domain S-box-containing protein
VLGIFADKTQGNNRSDLMPHFIDPEIYRDILDELQIGVSVLDLQRKIIFWSDGAEKITGYARIDVLGHSCAENIFRHCNQHGCEMCDACPQTAALHDAKPVESMPSIHHKSGYWTPVHVWTIPLRDKHGAIIGIIQTFESEFAVIGPDPNDRSMKERGCMDAITNLPNQAMMQSHLRESLATFEEHKIPLAVVCLEAKELAGFRARYGAEAAASILRVLARTLRNSVWHTDFVGRWHSDIFLVILSGCDEYALKSVCARLAKITARAAIQWWGEELSVPVLLGSASAIGGDTGESLMQRAEQALTQPNGTPVVRGLAAGQS